MAELDIQFGQIPFWAICRFGERSKIEIIVFSFICAKRFRRNGEAECPRQQIIEYTGLDKAQVSKAISKLKQDKWLEGRTKTRWFVPEIEPEKVDESSTNSPEIKVDDLTTKVDDLTTKVDDLTTKVDESSTRPYIRNSSSDFTDSIHTFRQKDVAEPRSAGGEKNDSRELVVFRKALAAFQDDYAKPTTKAASIANANAIRELFELARGDTKLCVGAHLSLQAEAFRNGRVDWTTVLKNFTFYQRNLQKGTKQNEKLQPNSNGNGAGKPPGKPSNYEISRSRDYSEFDGFDPIEAFAEKT